MQWLRTRMVNGGIRAAVCEVCRGPLTGVLTGERTPAADGGMSAAEGGMRGAACTCRALDRTVPPPAPVMRALRADVLNDALAAMAADVAAGRAQVQQQIAVLEEMARVYHEAAQAAQRAHREASSNVRRWAGGPCSAGRWGRLPCGAHTRAPCAPADRRPFTAPNPHACSTIGQLDHRCQALQARCEQQQHALAALKATVRQAREVADGWHKQVKGLLAKDRAQQEELRTQQAELRTQRWLVKALALSTAALTVAAGYWASRSGWWQQWGGSGGSGGARSGDGTKVMAGGSFRK